MNHKYSTIALLAIIGLMIVSVGAAELIDMNGWVYSRFGDEKVVINPLYFLVQDASAFMEYDGEDLKINIPDGEGYINDQLICLEGGNCDSIDGGIMAFDIRSSNKNIVNYNISDSDNNIISLYTEEATKYFLTGEAT